MDGKDGAAGPMNGLNGEVLVRVASPRDAEAVGLLLRASYPVLLASGYEPGLLARAIPFMVEANPALLSCGTWYVAEVASSLGVLAGCGGWTLTPPGGRAEPPDPAFGHVRHFATHPDWARRGLGRALFARCLADAQAAQVQTFECNSTIVAEPFYQALGFERLGPMTVLLGGRVAFPGVRMRLRLPPAGI